MLTRRLNTNLPISDILAGRHRLTGLRRTPLVLKGTRTDVHGIRVNAAMRVLHNVGNTANTKRPRSRTCVPTDNATILKL